MLQFPLFKPTWNSLFFPSETNSTLPLIAEESSFSPVHFLPQNFIKNSPMANERTQMGLAIFLMAMIWGGAKAQDCTNVIISMSPCLNYIQGNSTSPSSGCCTQLASVVRSQPQCLCQVLNGGGASLGISINQTQALELPKVCNVQTPPVSQCKAGSPADSPSGTPNTPGSEPSGRGSNSVPSTDNGSSAATSAKLAAPLLFCLVFVASYAF